MKFEYLVFVLFGTVLLFACNVEKTPEDSYFYASIDGAFWNGEVKIQGESESLTSQALIQPSGNPDIPDILNIVYNDTHENISVNISVPAEERATELTDDHNHFGMTLTNEINTGNDQVMLVSKTLSMHISKLETKNSGIAGINAPSIIVGNFTGVMIFERFENGQTTEEVHTVQGDFEYYSY